MNLYRFHDKPETLDHHDFMLKEVFGRALWKKRGVVGDFDFTDITAGAMFAYEYAMYIEMPFPAGEAAIATNAYYSFEYARRILKGPFKLGEAVIAKSAEYSYEYAHDILKGAFPAGEAKMMRDNHISYHYNILTNHKRLEFIQGKEDLDRARALRREAKNKKAK